MKFFRESNYAPKRRQQLTGAFLDTSHQKSEDTHSLNRYNRDREYSEERDEETQRMIVLVTIYCTKSKGNGFFEGR